jgi:hypothetical protein
MFIPRGVVLKLKVTGILARSCRLNEKVENHVRKPFSLLLNDIFTLLYAELYGKQLLNAHI